MTKYLIAIHIGPVQEFIASARRSKDLWFGSWLLSELSKAAAKGISTICDPKSLIFPALETSSKLDEEDFNVANKIVALVDLDKEPSDFCKEIEQRITEKLNELKEKAFKNIKGGFNKEIATKQIEDLFSFYWASSKLSNESEYQITRNRVENLLAARKNTRLFKPATIWQTEEYKAFSQSCPKSSLDGLRESVIPEDIYKSSKKKLWKSYKIRGGERLCGIGLLKRHGKKKEGVDSFFSTSHVAALPLLTVLKPEHLSEVTDFAKKLAKILDIGEEELKRSAGTASDYFDRYDGHILFRERYTDYLEESSTAEQKEKLSLANEHLEAFLKSVFRGCKPQPYYAILLADGDRMGNAIDKQNSPEAHRKLSRKLSSFAEEVSSIIKDHKGSLIYAGGDDVLALVPLHTVIKCAEKLRLRFFEELCEFSTDDISPTLSVAIAVVHHLEPLSDALDLARRTEKIAKNGFSKDDKKRNALAISVSKRSGSETTIRGIWDSEIKTRLENLIELHCNNELSEGVAHELKDLSYRLSGLTENSEEEKKRKKVIIELEAIRILKRKRSNQGTKEIAGETLQQLQEYLKEISVESLADELIVTKIFADAKKLSEGK